MYHPLSNRAEKKTAALTLRSHFFPNASHWGLLFQLFFLPLCTICVPAEQFLSLQSLILLSLEKSVSYSHSIVPGGLLVISYTILLIWSTSLMILPEILSNTSYGIRAQSAVIKSVVVTPRSAST